MRQNARQDIDLPPLERVGQIVELRVTPDPSNTRSRLDAHLPTSNLMLGYAECHVDDPQP